MNPTEGDIHRRTLGGVGLIVEIEGVAGGVGVADDAALLAGLLSDIGVGGDVVGIGRSIEASEDRLLQVG